MYIFRAGSYQELILSLEGTCLHNILERTWCSFT